MVSRLDLILMAMATVVCLTVAVWAERVATNQIKSKLEKTYEIL